MLPLRLYKGKYYVGNIEVLIYPIGIPLEVHVGTEQNFPSFGEVLSNLIGKLYEKEGIDLTRANACFQTEVRETKVPEQEVADGKIPGQRIRNFSIMCFKAVPANPDNKKRLEEMFSTSL